MKSLDLKQMGVQELDAKEMKSVDGGIVDVLLMQAIGCAIVYGAFMAGYNAGKNDAQR